MITDNVMKAEFCRQIGEMESARVILDNTVVDDDYLKGIVASIRKRLEANDSKVFIINNGMAD